MNMENADSWKQAKPDVVNSTFRHVINLGHREIVGYSKKQGFNEHSDLRINLAQIIGRLLRTQIPQGMIEIEIYLRHRPKGTPTPYNEEKILALYEDGYDIYGSLLKDEVIKKYLAYLYETQNFDLAMKLVVGKTNCVFTGKTYNELVEQCNELQKYYPRDKVERLYLGICKQRGWGDYEPQPTTPTESPNVMGMIANIANQKRV